MKIEIDVPDGISGDWEVKTFKVSEDEAKFASMRAMFQSGRGALPSGKYKKLTRSRTMVMSNTPDEIRDFMSFVWKAKGNILVNGLGLGVLLKALLDKKEVNHITVIEKSKDVINLVAPTYKKERVDIINSCAFEYQPEKNIRFDAVWHDIWDNITSENIPEMKKLTRKYGRKSDYQSSWCRKECENMK